MNPSRFQLPQLVSGDVRCAREDALRWARQRYVPKCDSPEGGETPAFRRLPVACTHLPEEATFPAIRKAEMKLNHLRAVIDPLSGLSAITRFLWDRGSVRRYQAICETISSPTASMKRWHEDSEFGRQRLTGVNPMSLRRLKDKSQVHEDLWAAAKHELEKQKEHIERLRDGGRLYYLEHPDLANPLVQKHLRPDACLASPVCCFWVDGAGNLMPLAIQLKPSHAEKNPVFTPSSAYYDWMMARAHVQAADAHIHEGTYHLLETHMVSGAVAMALARRIHPDHPLRQLMDPHYQYTLAINELALGDLLAPDGTIDSTLAAGVNGTLNAARLFYARWDFSARMLEQDLKDRGVDNVGALPFYYYRDDAKRVYGALKNYVNSMLALWYRSDEDVKADHELQEWVTELSSTVCGLPGFPQIQTCKKLFEVVTELLFRAGPQHAAVNNGQFDGYGLIPNMPGRLSAPIRDEVPKGGHYSKQEFWEAMPSFKSTLSQMGMVWVLSAPTVRTLLHAGETPAFHPKLCPEAETIIETFQRQLASISGDIERRNETLDIPYRYLDPKNISRSTDI